MCDRYRCTDEQIERADRIACRLIEQVPDISPHLADELYDWLMNRRPDEILEMYRAQYPDPKPQKDGISPYVDALILDARLTKLRSRSLLRRLFWELDQSAERFRLLGERKDVNIGGVPSLSIASAAVQTIDWEVERTSAELAKAGYPPPGLDMLLWVKLAHKYYRRVERHDLTYGMMLDAADQWLEEPRPIVIDVPKPVKGGRPRVTIEKKLDLLHEFEEGRIERRWKTQKDFALRKNMGESTVSDWLRDARKAKNEPKSANRPEN